MKEPKSLLDDVEEIEQKIARNRPIPFGTLIFAAILFGPIFVLLALAICSPSLFKMMHPAVLILFVFAFAIFCPALFRLIKGTTIDINPRRFMREYRARNIIGRTASFFFDSDWQMTYRITDKPHFAEPEKITINFPLGGSGREITVMHGNQDLKQSWNIARKILPDCELWIMAVMEEKLTIMNFVPRLDACKLSREVLNSIGTALNILYDADCVRRIYHEQNIGLH